MSTVEHQLTLELLAFDFGRDYDGGRQFDALRAAGNALTAVRLIRRELETMTRPSIDRVDDILDEFGF